MVAKLKAKKAEGPVAKNVVDVATKGMMDSAQQIWLAGLGALSKTQTEGTKLFDALVREGEAVQARTAKAADDRVEEVKGKVEEIKVRATDNLDKLEQVFEQRVSRVLNSLGVPTHSDIRDLTRQVEELAAQVAELTKGEAKKPAPRARTSRAKAEKGTEA